MGFKFFKEKNQKDFKWFSTQVYKHYESMLAYSNNHFMNLYEEFDLVDSDSVKTILPEIIQYLNFIIYLCLQQHWHPFGSIEAKIVHEFMLNCDNFIDNNVPNKYNKDNIKDRINNYDMVVRKQINLYGQSLYMIFDDKKLQELKSDAYGRCAVLFTDFLFLSRKLKDFASINDISKLIIPDITTIVDDQIVSAKTLEISLKTIKYVQTKISAIER